LEGTLGAFGSVSRKRKIGEAESGGKMNPLRRYREQILISKAELARKAGLSVLTINRIEKGESCRLDTKKKIILALDLKLSEKSKIFGSKK
jgi:DNA-binding XRE family transcriptional regulator